jgi:glucose-1-phosphate thymidylyltransferase
LKISCVEEIAHRMGYIDVEQLHRLAKPMKKNEYGKYLISIAKSEGKG